MVNENELIRTHKKISIIIGYVILIGFCSFIIISNLFDNYVDEALTLEQLILSNLFLLVIIVFTSILLINSIRKNVVFYHSYFIYSRDKTCKRDYVDIVSFSVRWSKEWCLTIETEEELIKITALKKSNARMIERFLNERVIYK